MGRTSVRGSILDIGLIEGEMRISSTETVEAIGGEGPWLKLMSESHLSRGGLGYQRYRGIVDSLVSTYTYLWVR